MLMLILVMRNWLYSCYVSLLPSNKNFCEILLYGRKNLFNGNLKHALIQRDQIKKKFFDNSSVSNFVVSTE